MHIWNIDTPESGSFEKVQSWRVFAKYRCFEESCGSAGENISSIQRTQKHVPDPSFCSDSENNGFHLFHTMAQNK